MLHKNPMSLIKKTPVLSKQRYNSPIGRSTSPRKTFESTIIETIKKDEKPTTDELPKDETQEDEKPDEDMEEISIDIVENWTGANLETLSQWIQISSLQIEVFDLAIKYFRSIVRRNVLLGLVFSTASGSISVAQFNSQYQQLFLNIIFTIMSFSVAIFTGLIKIYQIQERLEEFIQLKQEWIGFSVVITAEVQLPINHRKKAIDLITKHKNKYLDLLKRDVDIPNFIKAQAYKNLYHDKQKQYYLKNCERHKLLKEIWACADDIYFLKSYEKMDENILQYEDNKIECTHSNCICITSSQFTQCFMEIYKYCANHKDKYIGEKTALSNIILTVIMEEENHQRNKQILKLLNLIQERYSKIKTEKNKAISRKDSFVNDIV